MNQPINKSQPMTIEQAHEHYVSQKRFTIMFFLVLALLNISFVPSFFKNQEDSERPTVSDFDKTVASSEFVIKTLQEGLLRTTGGWKSHPILSVLVYLVLHDNFVSIVIAQILLGKLGEPSRRQVTASFWFGLIAGLALWTIFWGYQKYVFYILVFFSNTLFMNAIIRNTKTGQEMLRSTGGGRRPNPPN